MKICIRVCVAATIASSAVVPSYLSAAELKSTAVIQGVVRQCEYIDGVIIRLLASRECPKLEDPTGSKPLAITPTVNVTNATQPPLNRTASQEKSALGSSPQASVGKNDDAILDKAINRCVVMGFEKDTAEYRICIQDQIMILSR